MAWGWEDYGDYVSADEKRRRADAAVRKLEKKGRKLAPVRPAGRAIANSFWGKAWGRNLEGYSDYASRLPRGRSYLRQGAVLDLQVQHGGIKATVSGTRLYEVTVNIDMLENGVWARLKKDCAGRVDSLLDLLQGKLSASVLEIVTRREGGLFPKPREIHLDCSCPDHADLCKHVAATLYGVGARLDENPELLFGLRGVDHLELVASAAGSLENLSAPAVGTSAALDAESVAEIFGIDLADAPPTTTPNGKPNPRKLLAPVPVNPSKSARSTNKLPRLLSVQPAKATKRPVTKHKTTQTARHTVKKKPAASVKPSRTRSRHSA